MSTVLVVGASRGIGLELVKQYLGRGHRVFGTVRAPSGALAATGAEVIDGVEVATEQGRARLLAGLGEVVPDVVILNAGVLEPDDLSSVTPAAAERQMAVNAFAPLFLVQALAPRLERGARVALITSRMGSIGDNGSGGWYGYRMSKAALNMAGKSLALDLAPRGILVAILHPGAVRTEMTRGHGTLEASESALGLLARIDGLNAENSGSFWHVHGEVLPW